MTYEFNVGDKTYNLKLTTKAVLQLEKKIGCNPLSIFGTNPAQTIIPTMNTMIAVLMYALRFENKDITEDETLDIFDKWIEDGHDYAEFANVILEIFTASGLVKQGEERKN